MSIMYVIKIIKNKKIFFLKVLTANKRFYAKKNSYLAKKMIQSWAKKNVNNIKFILRIQIIIKILPFGRKFNAKINSKLN